MVFSEIISIGVELITNYGVFGVFLAMFIETIIPPIPSEIVMPLAGFLVYEANLGVIGLIYVIIAGGLGSTFGSVVIYWVSRYGGVLMVLKFGKLVGIRKNQLKDMEKWFSKYGNHAVFICRMCPGLREIVSIPAGLAKMEFKKFLFWTFLGSLIWSSLLGSLGYYLGDIWKNLDLGSIFNFIAIIVFIGIIIYIIRKHIKKYSNFLNNKKS